MRTNYYDSLLEYFETFIMTKIYSEVINKIIMLSLSSIMRICEDPKYQTIL